MERLTEAVKFLLKREIRVADPSVRAEGEKHLAAIDELVAEFATPRHVDITVEALDSESILKHSAQIAETLKQETVPTEN